MGNNGILLAAATGLLTSVAIIALLVKTLRRIVVNPDPIQRRICVLGAPGSGKTTLITRAVHEIIRSEVGRNVTVRGRATIDMLSENKLRLEEGKPVLKTSDGEEMIYRFDFARDFLGRRWVRVCPPTLRALFAAVMNPFIHLFYNIEMGDYAGELALKVKAGITDGEYNSDADENRLVRWALNSEGYVIVIDCSPNAYFNNGRRQLDFCQNLWMHICDLRLDRDRRRTWRNVCLYFNKVDVVGRAYEDDHTFETIPPVEILNESRKAIVRSYVQHEFADVIAFFKAQTDILHVVYGSSFATEEYGGFVGVDKFIKFSLPSPTDNVRSLD